MYVDNYFPHDVAVRELGTVVSRTETLKTLGVRVKMVKRLDIQDGIEAVRNILARCWIDKEKCHRLIEALKSYRKDYDPLADVYMNKPVHDWSSHASDAMRTLAVGERRVRDQTRDMPTKMTTNYNIHARNTNKAQNHPIPPSERKSRTYLRPH